MKLNDRQWGLLIGFLFILYSALRVGFCLIFGPDKIVAPDGHGYNAFALQILNNPHWLTTPVSSREPGYPLFLAGVYRIFGQENLMAVYIMQAVISTIMLIYIYRLASGMFGRAVGGLSLFWAGFYGFYVWYNIMILREVLVFFLLLFSFYHLWCMLKPESGSTVFKNVHLWVFSIGFALLIHVDARYLFYVPFFAVLFLIFKKIRPGLYLYAGFLIILTMMMIPWSVRNYIAYNGIVVLNTRTLDLTRTYHHNPYVESHINNVMNWGDITETSNPNYPSEKERKMIKQGFNPNHRSKEEIEVILKNIYPASTFFERKLTWLVELWRFARFSSYYFPFPDARFRTPWTLRDNVIIIACYGTLLPFMFVGIFFLLKNKKKLLYFLFFPIFVQTLLQVLQWGLIRYRMPIDSFIIILAMYGVYCFWDWLRTRKNNPKKMGISRDNRNLGIDINDIIDINESVD